MNMKKTLRTIAAGALMGAVSFASFGNAQAQTRRNVFSPGEELVYTVKYGFIKLGTMVVQTGNQTAGGVSTRMQFYTADVPFLNTKGDIRDVLDTKQIYITNSNVKWINGDKTTQKTMAYDPSAKTLNYTSAGASDVTKNVEPFNDILSLMYNLRTWSASNGNYFFPIRTSDGVHKVTVNFAKGTSMQEVAALDDKEIKTRVAEGHADMGAGSPLGANGDFKAYISDDEAAVPVKIDMKIGIGSISLELTKVKHQSWAAMK